VAAIVSISMLGRGGKGGVFLRRVAAPVALVLVPVAAMMLYYNWRVFGSPMTLPYQINRATYAVAQVFVWQRPAVEPLYHHKAMRDFFVGWEVPHFLWARTLSGFLQFSGHKIEMSWRFFIGPALTLPLLAFPLVAGDRRIRPLLITGAIFLAGLAVQLWFLPHYASPIAGLIWVLLLQGMRHIRVWRWHGKPVGVALVRSVALVCLLMFGLRIGFAAAGAPPWLRWPYTWSTVWTVGIHRQDVIAALEKAGGRHLVLVRYSEKHDPINEYVFNDAAIDASTIVWAREMGLAEDRGLIEYMKSRGRRVWLLEPDETPWKLRDYDCAMGLRTGCTPPG
jgi:hypothetical protein